ncbi:MAG: glucosidase [Verrucomicrobiota bacterium]
MNAEQQRLEEEVRREQNWKRWGPYLSERQWATVREDYSADGDSWRSFPHAHARSRAYRWGEDGLLGWTDRQCRLCFALALWNEQDTILKERLFGLTGPQGNHGEDVKECYYYLDSTPTHSYARALYKYPQRPYPYQELVNENARRGLQDLEFELSDTGIFDEQRYFDVFAEYAKGGADDILIRIEIFNRGSEAAVLHVLPTLWFRNTWSWGCRHEGCTLKPSIEQIGPTRLRTHHETLESFHFDVEPDPGADEVTWLFTENETNVKALYDAPNPTPYVKDAFHRFLIDGDTAAVNPKGRGTKAAVHRCIGLASGASAKLRLRLTRVDQDDGRPAFAAFDEIFQARIDEARIFDAEHIPEQATAEETEVIRQANAGLMWTKQFYHYIVEDWLEGDPSEPPPPPERRQGRNVEWTHIYSRDILSMPDKWEYPWFAAWDLAFHMVPYADFDRTFAKQQLLVLLREWYLHPNGQIPAYEFKFGDVNPPVHAWAVWRVYKITGERGHRDRVFLESAFQKLLLNFTWWVNRKDIQGNGLFTGGFLGLDNIGLFDRSMKLPGGYELHQADATGWMAFYAGTMLSIALELAPENPAYEDMASKFFEHFIQIVDAMNYVDGTGLWDEADGFYYDRLHTRDGQGTLLRTRSLVGLLPLVAVEVLEEDKLKALPGFYRRFQWFIKHRSDLAGLIGFCAKGNKGGYSGGHRLLALPSRDRLQRVLRYLLDEEEFLSPYGIRSLSKYHDAHPAELQVNGKDLRVAYVPGESDSYMFGGNSNWRGPIWWPMNYLLIEALLRYHHFYGDDFLVELPTGSGCQATLEEAAMEIGRRLNSLFLSGKDGGRPCHGEERRYTEDPYWKDLLLFHEYFHGETGRGLGATHQTGWTALVARTLTKRAGHRK